MINNPVMVVGGAFENPALETEFRETVAREGFAAFNERRAPRWTGE